MNRYKHSRTKASILSLLLFCIFIFPADVFGWCPDWWFGCLDSEGTGGSCQYECQITEVQFEKNETNRTHYRIKAKCDWKTIGAAACPPSDPKTVIGTAWWDKIIKLAYENVHNQYSEEFLVDTVSKCSSNPWTNPIDCNEIQRNVISNTTLPTAPISARLLSNTQKTQLKQQEDAATTQAQAPFFFEPVNNSEFEHPAKIKIKVRHLAQYPVEFKLQRKNMLSQPFVTYPLGNLALQSSPEGNNSPNRITTAVFEPDSVGFYRIKARCKTAEASWSDYISFEVTQLQPPKIIQPTPGQLFNKHEPVIIKATHHPANNTVRFSFKWSPKQEPGEWPATPVDIEPHTTGYLLSLNGETSCSYSFDKAGHYKVYARYSQLAISPESSQSFEISDHSIKNISKKQFQTSKLTIKPNTASHQIKFDQAKKTFFNQSSIKLNVINTENKKLLFDFGYKETNGGLFRPVTSQPDLTLDHINGQSVITLKNIKAGQWRVRVKTTEQHNKWTKWFTFSVVGPKKKLRIADHLNRGSLSVEKNQQMIHRLPKIPEIISPKKNTIKKTTSSVSFHIQHDLKSKLSFEFQYRALRGKGSYTSYSVNVGSFSTKNGKTAGSLSFNKAGEYRFRVKVIQKGARWSKWQTFQIKQDLKMKLRRSNNNFKSKKLFKHVE